MKLWLIGCRTFRVVGGSIVYHFSCKSTSKVRRNKGGRTFLLKWGISQQTFKETCVTRTRREPHGALPNLPAGTRKDTIKRITYAAARYPLSDLARWEPDLPRCLQSGEEAGDGSPEGRAS